MCDEKQSGVCIPNKGQQRIEDRVRRRFVQIAGRLICQYEFRRSQYRAGNCDALLLAARKLLGVLIQMIGQAQRRDKVACAFAGLATDPSARVVDAHGQHVGTYRKTHIPAYFPTERLGATGSFEKFYFTPGDALPVFDVAGARIGIQICNDRLYPEPSRVLARRGAEIIFMPICYSTYGDPDHRISIWEVPLRSRAYENGVWVAAVNRVGTEDPRVHIGRSMLVDPRGGIVREAGMQEPELLVQTIDLDAVTRQRKKFPWWRDSRPDLYDEIVHPD